MAEKGDLVLRFYRIAAVRSALKILRIVPYLCVSQLVPGDLDPSATGWPGLRANLMRGCKLPHLFFRLTPLGELEGKAPNLLVV